MSFIVDSFQVVRNNTDISHVPSTQITSCKGVTTRKLIHRVWSYLGFHYTVLHMLICVYVCSSIQIYYLCRFMYPSPQSRCKVVLSLKGFLVLSFCEHTDVPPNSLHPLLSLTLGNHHFLLHLYNLLFQDTI